MKVHKSTPLICTDKLAEQKTFYEKHLAFKTVFDAPNYLAMQAQNGGCEVSFMPAGCGDMKNYDGGSLTLCLHVDDVDKEHDRLARDGLTIIQPPTDNPWGDRSVIVLDPIGICVYLYEEIPMQAEFKQYVRE